MLSLVCEEGHRRNAYSQFKQLDFEVEWKIPIAVEEIPWGTIPSAFRKSAKYASRVATILEVLKELEASKPESFMLLEDDVIFHPRFWDLYSQGEVPMDWQFFYLGGRNNGNRETVSDAVIRSTYISDLHAVVIRGSMIPLLKQRLLDESSTTVFVDARIATLHPTHAAYLCRPNLAWQSFHGDILDSTIAPYCNYLPDGSVLPGQGD
jgi:hypothetical protein